MKSKIDTILDDCLAQLRAGASVEACLARYPEHAETLRPLLALASQVQSLPAPSPDRAAMNAGRQRMVEAVRARTARQEQGAQSLGLLGFPWLKWPQPFARGALSRPLVRVTISLALVILVMALSAGGLLAAAQGSLPGDPLYSLKRTAENVRMSLTFDPVAQQQLQMELDLERQVEIQAVLTAGRVASLEFKGILEHLDAKAWIVSGLTIALDDQSIIEGRPVLGALVVVHGDSLGNGTLLARRIQVESSPLPPSPTATRTTSPSPTPPSPTASATRTETPEPTASPAPTLTRQAPLAPAPTATPQPSPTETREPESTDHPEPGETEKPESTDHPESGETEEPEATDHPESGETEEPGATDHPEAGETEEPEATRQPEASATDHDDEDRTPSPGGTEQPEPSATATEESDAFNQPAAASPNHYTPYPEGLGRRRLDQLGSPSTSSGPPVGDST